MADGATQSTCEEEGAIVALREGWDNEGGGHEEGANIIMALVVYMNLRLHQPLSRNDMVTSYLSSRDSDIDLSHRRRRVHRFS